ncbi:hypothetical protein TIFTF001_005786 [Ficus carica]|uniref:Uncharacterized protein n=1 Tax=Ficus carica TaxID=3494 RepID=A0AA88CZV8_FICCA|nr:hypothetical protein TIFTF001_005786 [Ficus carica]
MGKNQAYKAMQRARLGSSSAGPEEVEDGMVDGSFHSPEWHAARLASLKTSHTITWEEFKKKQKGELEKDTDKMMREYRAQLDAERARKLAQGRNHSGSKSDRKRDRKDKDLKKRSSKKRKHSRRRFSESSSSSSSSDSSSSDEEEKESRRSKSRSRRSKKEKKRKSRTKHSGSDNAADGPVALSSLCVMTETDDPNSMESQEGLLLIQFKASTDEGRETWSKCNPQRSLCILQFKLGQHKR